MQTKTNCIQRIGINLKIIKEAENWNIISYFVHIWFICLLGATVQM